MSAAKPGTAKKYPSEDLVALRDEIAMRTLQTLLTTGRWGKTQQDGTHRAYSKMSEYSVAAYEFADAMLEARSK